ncbi:hypothetical protein M9Y10_016162 [Tritrichomonas musculus]|uniref:Uncharacterized protein n=1 Tax=Tritrichomonas musculus TaxID=1915356 RepID=A0ABR2I5G6_9EUKA
MLKAPREIKERRFQDKYERSVIQEKLENFDYKKSKAWLKLTSKFGDKVNHKLLLSIAHLVSKQFNIELCREYKRRKEMLIKWFDENIDTVWPYVNDNLVFEYVDGRSTVTKYENIFEKYK